MCLLDKLETVALTGSKVVFQYGVADDYYGLPEIPFLIQGMYSIATKVQRTGLSVWSQVTPGTIEPAKTGQNHSLWSC